MDKSFYLRLFLGYLGTVAAIAFVCVTFSFYTGEAGLLWIPLVCAAILFPIFLMVGIAYAVYHDAQRRGMSGIAWALAAVFVPYFLGVIVYLIVREPLKQVCGKCGGQIVATATFCPHCGHRLRQACPGCDKPVDHGVRFCPHCGAKIAA